MVRLVCLRLEGLVVPVELAAVVALVPVVAAVRYFKLPMELTAEMAVLVATVEDLTFLQVLLALVSTTPP